MTTNNQTIDGVPRELLSIYLGEIKGNRHDAGEKLRALLDAPIPFPGYPPVPEDRKLPAAQPHGEPVAYLDDNGKFVFIGYEKLRTACWVDANDRAIPEAWKPLYAEQPAPVTVVMPL